MTANIKEKEACKTLTKNILIIGKDSQELYQQIRLLIIPETIKFSLRYYQQPSTALTIT